MTSPRNLLQKSHTQQLMQQAYEYDDGWLGLLCTLHTSVQGFCVLSVTLCWEFDSKIWDHSISLSRKRIILGVSERKKPLFIAHRKKVKVGLLRKEGSTVAYLA